MRFLSLPLLLVFIIFTAPVTYAAQYYRHIPFTLRIQSHDIVHVDYNFSEKTGIYCQANRGPIQIKFDYKGRDKSAFLPVRLQSDHIPDEKYEELADYEGQFRLETKGRNNTSYEIKCSYIKSELH
ncbi:MAG: hypothetical protein H0W64_08620 [Gammaproteobacteria bacterium]|nr:hypothetical protein [Gammaproteobacteria bacterium]